MLNLDEKKRESGPRGWRQRECLEALCGTWGIAPKALGWFCKGPPMTEDPPVVNSVAPYKIHRFTYPNKQNGILGFWILNYYINQTYKSVRFRYKLIPIPVLKDRDFKKPLNHLSVSVQSG